MLNSSMKKSTLSTIPLHAVRTALRDSQYLLPVMRISMAIGTNFLLQFNSALTTDDSTPSGKIAKRMSFRSDKSLRRLFQLSLFEFYSAIPAAGPTTHGIISDILSTS
jgi:hypothetical protein